MSEQSDRFARDYLGIREPLSFAASVSYAQQRAGSTRGAARLLGLGESTLRGWRTGRRNISDKSRAKVVEHVRDLRTREPDDSVALRMQNNDRKRSRQKHRRDPVSASSLGLAPGTMAAARDVYVTTGSTEQAYSRFLKGVGNTFYRGSLKRSAGFEIDESEMYEGLNEDYGMVLI